MKLSFIVTRIYLGFFILITIMLGSAWFSIQATTQMTERVEAITNDSTPLLTRSSELTIAFLNINRSLTDYLSAMYLDELDPLAEKVTNRIDAYQTQSNWVVQHAKSKSVLETAIMQLVENETTVLDHIGSVTTLYSAYLDAKDRNEFQQSTFQPLANQLTSNLVSGLSLAQQEPERHAIQGMLSQVNVLSSDASKAFSMQDIIELRSSKRSFSSRQERFELASEQLKVHSPILYRSSKQAMDLFVQHVFSDQGSVAMHIQTYELFDQLLTQRQQLNSLINAQLDQIGILSEYAAQMATQMDREASDSAKQTMSVLAIISAVSTLIAIVIGMSIASSVKKPSQQVQKALQRLAEKDLTSKVNYNKDNEFGYVAKKVNLVLEHLSETITQLSTSADRLNEASIENQQTSEKLEHDIREQTAQTTQVATAMKQIECSVHEISESANQTLTIVTDAVEMSSEGQTMMKANSDLLGTLSSRLGVSTDTIRALEQEVASIESILEVISGISEQTNLLALNAAIEAARAGEQGRGFSVVADEVRVLAAKTTKSTLEIKEKIEQLQTRTEFAVSQVIMCADDMKQCMTQAASVDCNLQRIYQQLNDIEDRSTQIASATTEHQAVASDVTQRVSEIFELSEHSSQRFGKLSQQGLELERMAQQQLELTAHFKLPLKRENMVL